MSFQPSARSSAPRPRNRVAWIIGGLCAVVALLVAVAVAVGAIWFFMLRQTPEDTVEKYLDAWNAEDCETYEEVTTPTFRGDEQYSCEAWQEKNIQEQEQYTFEDTIGETEIDGGRATVRITETMTHGDTTEQIVYDFVLIKQEGTWRIDDTRTIEEPREI